MGPSGEGMEAESLYWPHIYKENGSAMCIVSVNANITLPL